jgi:hypothetical protein
MKKSLYVGFNPPKYPLLIPLPSPFVNPPLTPLCKGGVRRCCSFDCTGNPEDAAPLISRRTLSLSPLRKGDFDYFPFLSAKGIVTLIPPLSKGFNSYPPLSKGG